MQLKLSEEQQRAIRELSRITAGCCIVAIAAQWITVAATIAIAVHVNYWGGYAVAVVVVASRQHALGVLMHDAAHYRLFSNRFANDWISNIFLAYPCGVSTRLYRNHHAAHHLNLNGADDPDLQILLADEGNWGFPKLWHKGLLVFARDLFGVNAVSFAKYLGIWSPIQSPKTNWSERIPFGLWWLTAATVISFTKGWLIFLLLWAVPIITCTCLIFRLRALAEHVGVKNEHELNATRVVLPYPYS